MKNDIIQEAVTNDELNLLYDNLVQKSYKIYQKGQQQDNLTQNNSKQHEFEKDAIISIDQLKTDDFIYKEESISNIQSEENSLLEQKLKIQKQNNTQIYLKMFSNIQDQFDSFQTHTINNLDINVQKQKTQAKQNPVEQRLNPKWEIQEDEALKKLVQIKIEQKENKTKQKTIFSWEQIAVNLQEQFPRQFQRTANMCNQRWNRVLNPEFTKGRWTNKEDHTLLEALKTTEVGKWKSIAQKIEGRSDIQVRYRTITIFDWLIDNGAPKEYLNLNLK
ncbi:Myb-like_DNA-binding domain-containing protein [Hexamita inflata]|uniref:Myb-like DNA-binding domain-containing protein n=1 Tax=Hexamita inflata TaxID=28002 RepID=A0AA86TX53_9EUKA|nr:Myb-like DNA-binding domain-containing protein [Hexamita inflata]